MNEDLKTTRQGIRLFVHLWYTYGAEGSERVKRVVIATGGVVVLTLGVLLLIDTLHVSLAKLTALSEAIAKRFRPRDFAYGMTILTALTAAACTAFFGVITPHVEKGQARGEDPRWSLTALMISLVAAIAATLSFAGVFAAGSEALPTPFRIAELHMLIMAFVQLAISLGLVSVTVIPIVSGNKPGPMLGSVVSAISVFWWLPAGWLAFLFLAVPELFQDGVSALCIVLFLTMAQIYYPHGWLRTRNERSYEAALRGFRYVSYFLLGGCVIATGYLVISDIVVPAFPVRYYSLTTWGVFVTVGLALWFYSTSIEGQRKFDRYETSPSGELIRKMEG